MLLRRAGPADAAAIAALHLASWRVAYRTELPDTFLDTVSVEEHRVAWLERIARPDSPVVLLEDTGGLLGFAASGPTRDADASAAEVWELYNLHVAPDLRGAGLGSRLLTATLDLARRSGRGALSLWVVASNTPARRFYERYGMRPDGATQVHVLGPGAELHEVRYRLTLQ